MQKEQIIQEIQELQEKLKGLWAQLPRSDWHAAFEALLRIEIFPYGDLVQIHAEEEIGIMPPRMDFVILTEKEDIRFEKEIFRFFRRINVLEYKNPDDDLNERVIRKAVGYANLYISEAKHKGERPSDQVTISIFRSEQNGKLFKKMEEEGTLKKDAVPGIYHVIGLTDLPFQIVITSELKGEEYAAYRALKKKADNGDLRRVLDAMRQEKNSKLLEYYWRAFRLMLEKNEEFMDVLKEADGVSAEDMLMDLLKDRVDQKIEDAVKEVEARAEEAIAQERKKTEEAIAQERKKTEEALKEAKAWKEEAMAAKKQAEENTVKYMQMMEVMDRSLQ